MQLSTYFRLQTHLMVGATGSQVAESTSHSPDLCFLHSIRTSNCILVWTGTASRFVVRTTPRILATSLVRWSDIDLDGGVVRWRTEHERSG